MKLLSVAKARSVWLFELQDLNPQGRSLIRVLGEWLKSRYNFADFPASFTETEATKKNGYIFSNGTFQYGDDLIDVAITVYNDGLVADSTASTKATDAFLSDLLEGAKKDFRLTYDTSTVRKKLHVSELQVRCEKHLSDIGPKIEAFQSYLNAILAETEGIDHKLRLDVIQFRSDWGAPDKPLAFTFESRVNMPFSENRYYSLAPLGTEEHFKVLEKLEDLMG